MTWIKKWEVDGNNGHTWIVSLSDTGEWGCSCPIWKFRRVECHHIQAIKYEYKEQTSYSYTETEQQLLTIIKKCFNRIITKRKVFKFAINDDFIVGINSVGVGRVEKSKTKLDDKQVYKINDLETYLTILSNKTIVDMIKKSIHKEEKKIMLNALYNHLKEWKQLNEKEQEETLVKLYKEVEPYLIVEVI